MVRPSIGSSGYGRFLCSHYNPGTAFISYVNGLSQKIGLKQREKEMKQREEQENKAKLQQEKAKQAETANDQNAVQGKDSSMVKDEVSSNLKEEIKESNLQNIVQSQDDSKSITKLDPLSDVHKPQEIKVKSESLPSKITHENKHILEGDPRFSFGPKDPNDPDPQSKSKAIDEMMKDIVEDDIDIEQLALFRNNKEDFSDMVIDILAQNNSRLTSGKKKVGGNGSIGSQKPKPKRSIAAQQKRMREKYEKLLRILKNDDEQLEKEREANLKRAKKLEKKAASQKSDTKSVQNDDSKLKKPKVVKIKDNKQKMEKPAKKKAPTKQKYQGSVVKKKFAPKKIGGPEMKAKQAAASEEVQVVSQIESDDEDKNHSPKNRG